jgi:hypothetical protein
MYLNFQSYEKKYIKYKSKYHKLKSDIGDTLLPPKVPSLNGGNCDPLPNPEEDDFTMTKNLLDLCPDAKDTLWCL